MGKIKFIKTTSTKLNGGVVQETLGEDFNDAVIHVRDEHEYPDDYFDSDSDSDVTVITDNNLYIGDERITDNLNIGKENPKLRTRELGGLKESSLGLLQKRSLSSIIIDILRVGLPADSIRITTEPGKHLNDGETLSLEIEVDEGVVDTFTWTSSDDNVATVDDNGTITAHSTTGSAIIKVEACTGSGSAEYVITVDETLVTSITDTVSIINNLKYGGSRQLSPTVKPSTATDSSITWSTSDPNTISVDNGLITVIGTYTEQVTITATANDGGGAKKTYTVNVQHTNPGHTNPSITLNCSVNGPVEVGTPINMSLDIRNGSWTGYWINDEKYNDGYENVQLIGVSSEFITEGDNHTYTFTPTQPGVYTIQGSVDFKPGDSVTDDFGQNPQQYTSGTGTKSDPKTIVVVYPISISTGSDISEMIEQPLFNYLGEDGYILKVDVPEESLDDKFRIQTSETFEFFTNALKESGADESLYSTVYQYNKFSEAVNEDDKYDILIDMVFDTDTYFRTLDPTDRKGPSKYKIKFKK